MRMIKTYEGMTMNCDVIATIQSVFMNIATGSISEMVDDSFDPDTLEFAVTAFTTLGDEIVLAVYATEEERDYARYKLENWLCAAIGSEDAVKIAKQFGGNEIEIPLGPFGGNRGRVWSIRHCCRLQA